MRIIDFNAGYIEQAALIAKQNYDIEREFVPTLPLVDKLPPLTEFVDNGFGVAAFDGDAMTGFLCSVSPFPNAFDSTDATGVFSPLGANGAVGKRRAEVYSRMYQAAGEKWVSAGAGSHAICLFAHDKEVLEQFFRCGFGLRCVDAIRDMGQIPVPNHSAYRFKELARSEYTSVFPLSLMLNRHQCESPFFMKRKPETPESFAESCIKCGSRFFAATHGGKICAYLKVLCDGENFIAETNGYIHIGGAFCLPEHRGKGVFQRLLNYAVSILKSDGYTRLGVDFESINPVAWGFWRKYFDVYTHSVVRRIDEFAVVNKR